jgi:hypothetical protein
MAVSILRLFGLMASTTLQGRIFFGRGLSPQVVDVVSEPVQWHESWFLFSDNS